MGEQQTASRSTRAQVDVEGHSAGRSRAGHGNRGWRGCSAEGAGTNRAVAGNERPPASGRPRKTELYADVLRERARSRNYPPFDFHLLRLAVQLTDQIVDHGNDRRDVPNDQLIRTVV